MKNARPHNKAETSAKDKRNSTRGTLPCRINTVMAGVLAELLEGRTITGMEAVFNQSTTRAAAVIHYLESQYGWSIERTDVAAGTRDGRVAWVTAYWLSIAVRVAAFADGARGWVDEVKDAAWKRRQGASDAKARAAEFNASGNTLSGIERRDDAARAARASLHRTSAE
ncbi:helix-turn-helix domain-containing protein [Paraburkholderia sediminicola]|uniref:helix-turn-helix domain-containing protein n=1 Tax=Paraburkholderia sediminicola TaxID=458836 RepID=UPI0038B8D405